MGKTKLPIRTVLRRATSFERSGRKTHKKPYFGIYPGDLKKDVGYQSLDLLHKGAWLELMFAMHESEQFGRLILNGSPMPDEAVARIFGTSVDEAQKIVGKLLEYGVASKDPKTNILYCRRMVRDKKLSEIRSLSGSLGGNPALLQDKKIKKIEDLLNLRDKATFSSSFSSSFSKEKEDTQKACAPSFSSPENPPPAVCESPPQKDPITPEKIYEIWDAECDPLPKIMVREPYKLQALIDYFNGSASNGTQPENLWRDCVRMCREAHPDYQVYMDPVWFANDLGKLNKLLRGAYRHGFTKREKQRGAKPTERPSKGSPDAFKGKKFDPNGISASRTKL